MSDYREMLEQARKMKDRKPLEILEPENVFLLIITISIWIFVVNSYAH